MKFHFENLGPIKNADIELGDLTLFLGYPSSGKSYILKGIYHSLLLLDGKFHEIVKGRIFQSLLIDLDNLVVTLRYIDILAPTTLLSFLKVWEQAFRTFLPNIKLEKTEESEESITYVYSQDLDTQTVNERIRNAIISLINEELQRLAYVDGYKVELNGVSLSTLIKVNVELVEKEIEIYSSQNLKIIVKLNGNKVYLNFTAKRIKIETDEDIIAKEILNIYNVVKDRNLLSAILTKIEAKPILANFIDMNKILNDVYLVLSMQSGYSSVLFIPYGRQILLLQSEPTYFLYKAFKEYYYDGIKKASDKYIMNVVKSLTKLDISFDERGIFFRLGEKELNFAQVSAMVSEISGLLMPLKALSKPALVLIEEPESQLHPAYQVAIALILLSLIDEYKFVISTHSDIISLIIGEIVRAKPSKEKIKELVNSLGVTLPDEVIKRVEKVIKGAKVKVYYVKDGTVNEVDVNSMYKAVPGITEEVMDKILDWELRLL